MSYSYGSDHSKHVGCHNALVFMQSRSTEKVQYGYLDLSESHLFTSEEAFPTLASITKVVDFKKVLSGDSGSAVYLKDCDADFFLVLLKALLRRTHLYYLRLMVSKSTSQNLT